MKPLTILLTAVDAATRQHVSLGLTRYGHEVVIAASEAEARAALEVHRRIHVLVAAIETGGLPLAREGRARHPDLGVVYTAALPHRVDERGRVAGAPILRAPYAVHQLAGVIAGLNRRTLDDPLAA